MTLAEVVAAAVRQRTPELEQLVREQVDVELKRLVPELIERELAARRNGSVGNPLPPDEAGDDGSSPDEHVLTPTHVAGGDPSPGASRDAPGGQVVTPPNLTKRCATCGLTKPLDDFPPRYDEPGKHRNVCRPCDNARRRKSDGRSSTKPRRGVLERGGRLVSPDDAEHVASKIAEAVDVGVVERDGRLFRLLRLPDVVARTQRTPIVPRQRDYHVVSVV